MDFQTFIFDPSGMGDQLFFLFVLYRFMSNRTQVTEFPESKSDMQLKAWRMEITTCTGNFFLQKFFQMDPSARKWQESGHK